MASFRKRGKTWTYIVEGPKDPVTGERNQIPKGSFKTKAEAETAAKRLEVEIADGTYVKESNIIFEEYCKSWLKMYIAGVYGRKPKKGSIRQREFQIAVLLRYFAKAKLASITHKRYQEVILELAATMERNTIVGIHGVGSMMFRKAVELGEIKQNPTEYTVAPASEEDEEVLPQYMEKEELVEFIEVAKTHGEELDFEFFLTMAYTGFRIGEECALTWTDTNPLLKRMSVNGTLYNPLDISNQYEIVSPKTKTSRRTIDVDPIVFEALENLKARQNQIRMRYRNTYHDAGFVFARVDRHHGYPVKRRTMELRFKRLLQFCSFDKKHLTPHSLRHTHASLLAEAGASLESIYQRLGHKNDNMVKQIYLHVTEPVKQEASQKFSALMSNVVKL